MAAMTKSFTGSSLNHFIQSFYFRKFSTVVVIMMSTLIHLSLTSLLHLVLGSCGEDCPAAGDSLLQAGSNKYAASAVQEDTTTTTTWPSPYYMMHCAGEQAVTTQRMTEAEYDGITAKVQALYDSLPLTCTPTECPQADWAGCVLRMAGHDFMDYKDGVGGADGCVARSQHPGMKVL